VWRIIYVAHWAQANLYCMSAASNLPVRIPEPGDYE
jgi:hypothetical protein